MKFAQFEKWMLRYILQKFQIREQSSFLNVLYHSALETKVWGLITYVCAAAVTQRRLENPVGWYVARYKNCKLLIISSSNYSVMSFEKLKLGNLQIFINFVTDKRRHE